MDSNNRQMKAKARREFAKALKLGIVVREACCEKCGSTKDIEGHHTDYSKPLDVIWLCRPCHVAEHGVPHFVGSPHLGRPRVYADNAARQKAHYWRKKQAANGRMVE